jgi:hypothetical protein
MDKPITRNHDTVQSAYTIGEEIQRNMTEIELLTEPYTPLLDQIFKLKDGLDHEKVTREILDRLPHAPEVQLTMLTDEIRCEFSNAFPSIVPDMNGRTHRSIKCNLNFYEILMAPDGRTKEKRRGLGSMLVSMEWFSGLFQPVSPNEFITTILAGAQAKEKKVRMEWEKFLANQPPPPPIPNQTTIAALVQALTQLQSPVK